MRTERAFVVGCGKVGWWIGGTMASAGHEVTMFTEGKEVNPGTWSVKVGDTQSQEVQVKMASTVGDYDPPSVVILCHGAEKVSDDASLVRRAWRIARPNIISIANGLWEESGVIPCILNSAFHSSVDSCEWRVEAWHEGVAQSYVLEADPCCELADIFSSNGLKIQPLGNEEFEQARLEKARMNSVANCIAAVTGLRMRAQAERDCLRPVVRQLNREAADALGISEDLEKVLKWLYAGGEHMPSSAASIIKDRATRYANDEEPPFADLAQINGAIIDRGREQSMPMCGQRLAFELVKLGIQLNPEHLADSFAELAGRKGS